MRDTVLYSDNGVLEDLTSTFSTRTGTSDKTFAFTAAEDAIYIGSLFPFTSKYLRQTSANISAASVTVQYWDGSEWRNSAHTVDETASSGVPFATSDYLNFSADRRYSWKPEDTTELGVENITGLGGVNIYDQYWVKITYSADIAMTVDWIGDLFCSDDQIRSVSPRVMEPVFMDDWQLGKTGWDDQRSAASELVIAELQTINLNSANLLLDKTELKLPTIYRTLALIYSEMGDDERANKYNNRVNLLLKRSLTKDSNRDGSASRSEAGIVTKRMVR